MFGAFRRSKDSGKVDRVSPRKPEPDGDKDAAFDLEIEGDFDGLVLYSEAASFAATTTRPELAPPPKPDAKVALPKPPTGKPPPFAMTKHFPVLFAFEDDALVTYDGSKLARSERTGKRTLRLYTWDAPGARAMRVFAELPDGSYVEGPAIR